MLVCVIPTLVGTLAHHLSRDFVLGLFDTVRVHDGLDLASTHDVDFRYLVVIGSKVEVNSIELR